MALRGDARYLPSTQGLWAESMRRAWAFEMLSAFDDVLPKPAAAGAGVGGGGSGAATASVGFPRLADWDELVELCEAAFLKASPVA